MAGHRRISTELFRRLRPSNRAHTKIEALLELDDDHAQGVRRSVRAYARAWGWSRDKVAPLLVEFEAHLADLYNAALGVQPPDQIPARDPPKIGHQPAIKNVAGSGGLTSSISQESATDRPESRPGVGHAFREPNPSDPNWEGRQGQVPPNFSMRGINPEDARLRGARRQVELALERVGKDRSEGDRKEIRQRLEILAEASLAGCRTPDASALAAHYRQTLTVQTRHLQEACDRASGESERNFPPAPEAITRHGKKLAAIARRGQRGVA